jgi:hypothetical protein
MQRAPFALLQVNHRHDEYVTTFNAHDPSNVAVLEFDLVLHIHGIEVCTCTLLSLKRHVNKEPIPPSATDLF